MPRQKLSPDEHRRRGTYQPVRHADRHGLVAVSGGVPDFEEWVSGLSKPAQVQGTFLFAIYQFDVSDRQRFRHYCRAYAVRERLRARRIAEEGQVEAWLWRISQRLAPWRRR